MNVLFTARGAAWVAGLAGFTIVLSAAPNPAERGEARSPAQADAGRAAYDVSCSGCHQRDLKGANEAPQLAGPNFLNQWGDKTIGELHTYLMASMPPTSPGAPGAETMMDIVAYLLQANGAAARRQPLASETA